MVSLSLTIQTNPTHPSYAVHGTCPDPTQAHGNPGFIRPMQQRFVQGFLPQPQIENGPVCHPAWRSQPLHQGRSAGLAILSPPNFQPSIAI